MRRTKIVLITIVVVICLLLSGYWFYFSNETQSNVFTPGSDEFTKYGFVKTSSDAPFGENSTYREIHFLCERADATLIKGLEIIQEGSVADPSVFSNASFYKSILNNNLIQGAFLDIDPLAKVDSPYINVFYIYNPPEAKSSDYIVVFIPFKGKNNIMHTYIFTVLPTFMNSAISDVLHQFINDFGIPTS